MMRCSHQECLLASAEQALYHLPCSHAQAFTLVLAICLSVGSPKPSAVFSVCTPLQCFHVQNSNCIPVT